MPNFNDLPAELQVIIIRQCVTNADIERLMVHIRRPFATQVNTTQIIRQVCRRILRAAFVSKTFLIEVNRYLEDLLRDRKDVILDGQSALLTSKLRGVLDATERAQAKEQQESKFMITRESGLTIPKNWIGRGDQSDADFMRGMRVTIGLYERFGDRLSRKQGRGRGHDLRMADILRPS